MTVMSKWFRSGIEEQRRLAAEVGTPLASDAETFRRRQQEEQEAGEACNRTLHGDEGKPGELPRPDPPQSAWVVSVFTAGLSTAVSLVAALWVAVQFNNQTVNGSALLLLLIPAALVTNKLSSIAHKVGRIHELRSLSERADRGRGYAFIASFLTVVSWGIARSIPLMSATVVALANGGMWAMELTLGWAAAESAALLLVHSRAPLHFRSARKFQRLADATEAVTAVVGGQFPASRNGAGPAKPATDRRNPTGVSNGS